MTSRERFLITLSNGRADRMPCQVHGWMDYYLRNFAKTDDWIEANKKYGFDNAIYVSPEYEFSENDLKNFRSENEYIFEDGYKSSWRETIHTPDGDITCIHETNEFTHWVTEPLIKSYDDFKIWSKWRPIPVKADMTAIDKMHDRLGDDGIIRCHPFSAGQGSPWQSLCMLMGTEEAIFMAYDEPDMMHEMLKSILDMTLKTAELWTGIKADMIETDGGAGSNTVISPAMFEEFCLPYDKLQNDAFHDLGLKVVCHLCGGVMKMLDNVVKTGADGLETMTPASMGGDCDLKEASRLVGDKLFFIGGFDQNAGFENGTPEVAKKFVYDCFEATKDNAGYIIAPSDHFFFGAEENLKAFCEAVHECTY